MEILKVKAQCSHIKVTGNGFTVEGPSSEVMKCMKIYEKHMQQKGLPYKQRGLPCKEEYTPPEC